MCVSGLSRRAALPLAVLLVSGLALGERTSFMPWEAASFNSAEARQLAERELYPAGRPELPLRLAATVLFDRSTPWTQARALRQLRKTSGILETCGVAFGSVTLVRLALPPADRRIDVASADSTTGVPPTVARLSAQLSTTVAYPAIFLISRVAGTAALAVSYRSRFAGEVTAPYFNTAWIAYQSHWLPRQDDRYSPLAHELAHILCRCGHTSTPQRHLLHGARNFLSADVLDGDCGRIRSSPLLTASD